MALLSDCTSYLISVEGVAGFAQAFIPLAGTTRGFLGALGDNLKQTG